MYIFIIFFYKNFDKHDNGIVPEKLFIVLFTPLNTKTLDFSRSTDILLEWTNKLKILSLALSLKGLVLLFCGRCKILPLSFPAIILIEINILLINQ